jgi:CheY-like chemotaxis protein
MRLSLLQKRILVVSHDSGLRATRSALLVDAGYAVATAPSAEEAIELLDANTFDLVLLGRRSLVGGKPLDQLLRERYPDLLILKIAEVIAEGSRYPTQTTTSVPANVLAALKGMLP